MSRPTLLNKKKLNIGLKKRYLNYWHRNIFTKIFSVLTIIVLVLVIFMYGVAQWYIESNKNKPLKLGVSFIPDYARSLGLNPKDTMDALLNINVKHFRLVSYWNNLEPSPGQFDFSQLDWQFQKAKDHGAKITLVLGLRQPRWPECQPPSWVDTTKPTSIWQPQLLDFIKQTVDRYKNSAALEDYQLENEYFLKGFGLCNNFSRGRLVAEYNLVKALDVKHPIIIGRSNNSIGFPIGQPQPDQFGISVYKRVWDASATHRYFEYPYPAWFYGFLAGYQKIYSGKDMVIDELQAEAWAPNGKNVQQISISEQNKSLNAKRLQDRFGYGKATGMRQIQMWGAEYWYYRLTILHDPSLWNVAKNQFALN
ncbi:MAG TPA: beta-galactosidase [Patescibacteria group bacterium]|nr:beta-galactosidase [Patescibacteria group bacterium]